MILLLACATPTPGESADTGGPEWPCGPYSPQTVLFGEPGAVNYRSTFDYDSGTFGTGTFTFEGLGTADMDGTEVWIHRGSGDTTDAEGTRHEWVVTTSYVCDELGLQQAHVEDSQTLTPLTGTAVESSSTREFSVRPVVYPPDLALGTVWEYHAVYTETHSDGTSLEKEETVERNAESEEEVTVPAGTFDTLHIVMTNLDDGNVGELWTTQWTGTVRTTEMQLVTHETFE